MPRATGMASGFSVAALYERRTCRDPGGVATKEHWWRRESVAALNFGAHRAPPQGWVLDAKLAGV